MRNLTFGTGEFYHVYNRGVDKRKTFLDDTDYDDFLSAIYKSKYSNKDGKQLVNIHAYVCMPNHFHFLVEQLCDNGIAEFMQRIGTRYTRTFNRRHARTGRLFETTYKAKHINNDAYLTTIAVYIHRNPMDLLINKTVQQLDSYHWSSYPHYRGLTQNVIVDDVMLWEYFGVTHSLTSIHMIEDRETTYTFDE